MRQRRTRIKVCGLTREEDVRAAVEAGADAVGVILADSPRRVAVDRAAPLLAVVPPFVTRVGVFLDAPLETVCSAVEALGLGAVQLHGAEPPDYCDRVPVPVIKAFRVAPGFETGRMAPYNGHVAALLLDTYVTDVPGGTGMPIDWDGLPPLPRRLPIVLAGGLDEDNVGRGIAVVRPFAVDVSSGVETTPGVKDHHRIAAFVAAVRAADAAAAAAGTVA